MAFIYDRAERKLVGGNNTALSYNAMMGLTVGYGDDPNLPDPSEWSYQVGDLDTSGKRDATGLLHRAYVTTKINYEFTWKAL